MKCLHLFVVLLGVVCCVGNVTTAPGIPLVALSRSNIAVAPVSNRSWTINAISPEALNICFKTFFAFAIANGLFWVCCGYRYFRPVLYQAGFLYGLYITLCVFASRIPLGMKCIALHRVLTSRRVVVVCSVALWWPHVRASIHRHTTDR